jgi:hypothetical protein
MGVLGATDKISAAIHVNRSPNIDYACNHVSNTLYGWWIQDESTTASSNFKNNDWTHHYYGILCTPFTQDGTLGDMGAAALDHTFLFNGNYDNEPNQALADRIYRVVNTQQTGAPVIYTNGIVQNQSGANIVGQSYGVQPTSLINAVPACAVGYTPPPIGSGGDDFNYDLANQIIADSIAYYANPTVARWLAEIRLYEKLSEEPSLLADPDYNTFYAEKIVTPTDAINRANHEIRQLLTPACLADSNAYALQLTSAKDANNDNTSTEVYEENERMVALMLQNAIGWKTRQRVALW